MKYITLLIALIVAIIPVPAFAFDPPGQGTDNATDVILWYGDNLTIEDATVTGEITGNVSISGEVELTGLTGTVEEIAYNYLAFLIVAFLLCMVFWKGGVVLKAIGVPVSIVYGLRVAATQEVYSALWVASVSIAIVGVYLLYDIVTSVWLRKRGD